VAENATSEVFTFASTKATGGVPYEYAKGIWRLAVSFTTRSIRPKYRVFSIAPAAVTAFAMAGDLQNKLVFKMKLRS
jgi:hypothetical protein